MDFSHTPTQNYVLKVHLQCCETCPSKVKKMLQRIEGVYSISMDVPGGMLAVSGKASPSLLIKMLEKSGKKAELVSFQMDPMHEQNNLHLCQGHDFCCNKNFTQYGGERIDQHCCGHNGGYNNYHDGNCHFNEYDYGHHCVCKMKHICDKENRPKMIWSHPHYNKTDHDCFSSDAYEYGMRCPPCWKYGENRSYGMYDMPCHRPRHNYFQPQPAQQPQPIHNCMNYDLNGGSANGCSVM